MDDIDSLRLADKWRTLEVLSLDGRSSMAPINISNRTSVSVNISRLPQGQFIGLLRKEDGSFAILKFVKL